MSVVSTVMIGTTEAHVRMPKPCDGTKGNQRDREETEGFRHSMKTHKICDQKPLCTSINPIKNKTNRMKCPRPLAASSAKAGVEPLRATHFRHSCRRLSIARE
jgi:hypothetical protein